LALAFSMMAAVVGKMAVRERLMAVRNSGSESSAKLDA
jgi:hypothetical protein